MRAIDVIYSRRNTKRIKQLAAKKSASWRANDCRKMRRLFRRNIPKLTTTQGSGKFASQMFRSTRAYVDAYSFERSEYEYYRLADY